ncbi:hypothetical protein NQ318_020307 [Aromia moschata]|uniref:Uncharacterized protein n=1 Tax=Aromia moschata TaxID=1265417 RepID=A0AAV8ZAM7_9CUCU|nr:hypothetical protein NQ318_020307 [Aromia moschata]
MSNFRVETLNLFGPYEPQEVTTSIPSTSFLWDRVTVPFSDRILRECCKRAIPLSNGRQGHEKNADKQEASVVDDGVGSHHSSYALFLSLRALIVLERDLREYWIQRRLSNSTS